MVFRITAFPYPAYPTPVTEGKPPRSASRWWRSSRVILNPAFKSSFASQTVEFRWFDGPLLVSVINLVWKALPERLADVMIVYKLYHNLKLNPASFSFATESPLYGFTEHGYG